MQQRLHHHLRKSGNRVLGVVVSARLQRGWRRGRGREVSAGWRTSATSERGMVRGPSASISRSCLSTCAARGRSSPAQAGEPLRDPNAPPCSAAAAWCLAACCSPCPPPQLAHHQPPPAARLVLQAPRVDDGVAHAAVHQVLLCGARGPGGTIDCAPAGKNLSQPAPCRTAAHPRCVMGAPSSRTRPLPRPLPCPANLPCASTSGSCRRLCGSAGGPALSRPCCSPAPPAAVPGPGGSTEHPCTGAG